MRLISAAMLATALLLAVAAAASVASTDEASSTVQLEPANAEAAGSRTQLTFRFLLQYATLIAQSSSKCFNHRLV